MLPILFARSNRPSHPPGFRQHPRAFWHWGPAVIRRSTYDRVLADLEAGRSYRQIQQSVGVCRDTIARIRRGQIARPAKCPECKPDGQRGQIGRCGHCGRLIDLPCCACCAEQHRGGPRPIGEIIEELEPVIQLNLRPAEAARLRKVQARWGIPPEKGVDA